MKRIAIKTLNKEMFSLNFEIFFNLSKQFYKFIELNKKNKKKTKILCITISTPTCPAKSKLTLPKEHTHTAKALLCCGASKQAFTLMCAFQSFGAERRRTVGEDSGQIEVRERCV